MAVEKVLLKISCDNWLVVFGVLVGLLLRNITTLHPYSGQGDPPMYGDYEAQRHWMEITTNLPINEWYKNSTNNNLNYWGLDYPPLTAYHMYLCGSVSNFLNVNYTKLFDSRGFESENHKFFMRLTVLLCDITVFIPSLIVFYYISANIFQSANSHALKCKEQPLSYQLSVILALVYPGIILIDHGHFQYNCVSLGLLITSIVFLTHQSNILASIFFCAALNYKQMELYHSLPFFFYLLSTCIPKPGEKAIVGFLSLIKLGLTVILCFIIIWAPFLTSIDTAFQVLHRQFPFARGIFEDKVSNFWCFLNVFYKLKTCNNTKLMRLCLFTTLTAIFPSSIDLFSRPSIKKFLLALINSSLAFFLFSYQVHEKTILIAALPVMLYFPQNPFACFWFLFISVFSMIPLFVKDNLIIAVASLTSFYTITFYVCMKHHYVKLKSVSQTQNSGKFHLLQIILANNNVNFKSTNNFKDSIRKILAELNKTPRSFKNLIFFATMLISLVGCVIIFMLTLCFKPPLKYPDLFPLIISIYSCVHFLGFFVYFNIKQFQIAQDFGEIGNVKLKEK